MYLIFKFFLSSPTHTHTLDIKFNNKPPPTTPPSTNNTTTIDIWCYRQFSFSLRSIFCAHFFQLGMVILFWVFYKKRGRLSLKNLIYFSGVCSSNFEEIVYSLFLSIFAFVSVSQHVHVVCLVYDARPGWMECC